MLDYDLEKYCYGCGLCAQICPEHAIAMAPNFEGFVMPYIDNTKCVKCGKCDAQCAYLNPSKTEKPISDAQCQAAFRIDDAQRMRSASGGVAAVVIEAFIKNGGVAVGCAWTASLIAKHMVADTIEESYKFRSSKYVQSDMADVYRIIDIELRKNKKVLFIGTPCQTGAVRNMFGNTEGLFLVGLICAGVPSPKVWLRFKEEKEKEYCSKMIHANFRNKGRYGWNSPEALYQFENGKTSSKLSYQEDEYVLQYLYGVFKRNSCYQCGYKGDNINADLILGDFWGSPEFRKRSKNKGVSAVLIISDKGLECADMLKEDCEIIETSFSAILQKNQPLISSVGRGGNRESFFEILNKAGYHEATKRAGVKSNAFKSLGIRILDRLRLFELVKCIIKEI